MITDKAKILKAFVSVALTQATGEVKTEMLREMNFSFKTYVEKEFNIDVTMIQPAPSFDYDNDDSSECSPNLVLIQDDIATRYVNGKVDQVVNINYNTKTKNIKADIEYFREHGVELEEIAVEYGSISR